MNYADREAYIQTLLTDLKLLESRVDTLKQIIFEKNVRIFEKNVRIAELENADVEIFNSAEVGRMGKTIEALRNASKDGYRLSAYEKTLILDAGFIFQALSDQAATR